MKNQKSKFAPVVLVIAGLLSCVMSTRVQAQSDNFDHAVIDAMVKYRTMGLKERMRARPQMENMLTAYAKHKVAAIFQTEYKEPTVWSYSEAAHLFNSLAPKPDMQKATGSWKEVGFVSSPMQTGIMDMRGLDGGRSISFEEISGNPFQKSGLFVSLGGDWPGKLNCSFEFDFINFKYNSGGFNFDTQCRMLMADDNHMVCREYAYGDTVYRAFARK